MAKILIVEDDEKIAWLEKDYLESNGYETDIIDDGRKVIRCFPDLTAMRSAVRFGTR